MYDKNVKGQNADLEMNVRAEILFIKKKIRLLVASSNIVKKF